MKDRRLLTVHNVLVTIGAFIAALVFALVAVEVFKVQHGYSIVAASVLFVVVVLFVDRMIIIRRYSEEHKGLMADLELKDVLYQLLQKTSSYGVYGDLYDEVLLAAINAVEKGSRGSIIDVRNKDKVTYVAVEGFERRILENMGIGLKDTYLYKETDGAMDKTVIIKNSVNYNKLHANDEIINDLIEAGTAGVKSTLCTPIKIQNQTIGMINIDSTLRDAFSERDIKIIEIFALEVGKMIQYYEVLQENLYLSRYDSMTKVYNRGYFYEQHRELYSQEPRIPYIFVSTDIDNLKEVNDTYGHMMGDQLLVKFVDTIKSCLPKDAIFGRYGGDEFNILFPNMSMDQVESIMKQAIVYLKANPFLWKGDQVYVAYSYGMVAYPDEEENYKELIVLADQRMYEQKNRMKGQSQL